MDSIFSNLLSKKHANIYTIRLKITIVFILLSPIFNKFLEEIHQQEHEYYGDYSKKSEKITKQYRYFQRQIVQERILVTIKSKQIDKTPI